MEENNNINYRRMFGIQKGIEKQLKQLCPNISHKSGIYFWIRQDDTGKYAYIGKSIDVLKRNASHIQGRQQRIDGSIKKRGFYSQENELGWKLGVLYFPKEELDKMEQYYIDKYRNAGYDLYNIESGGTDGKTLIDEKKAPRGYHDGIWQGKETLCKELRHIIDKYLVITLRKDNKLSQKALAKFKSLLENKPKDTKSKEI